MDPNYEWKFKKGKPVALTGAFGIKLPEEIKIERLCEIQEELIESSCEFISNSKEANDKLHASLPSGASELQFAKTFLYYQIHLHQVESGERITFVDSGKINAYWEKQGNELDPYEGLNAVDKKRAQIVSRCEAFVLEMFALLEAGASRMELQITPRQLYEVCADHYPWFGVDDSDEGKVKTFQMLLEILLEDCWVVFNNSNGQSNLLPYGEGIPGYDADLRVEHPMWNN